jgi:hypothetical protein
MDEGNSEYGLSIFPNPVSGVSTLYFEGSANIEYQILVMNEFGQLIMQEERTGVDGINSTQLDLQSYASGLYFVTIASDDGKQILKVVKE